MEMLLVTRVVFLCFSKQASTRLLYIRNNILFTSFAMFVMYYRVCGILY